MMDTTTPRLSVVLPCHDEGENLPELRERLVACLDRVTGGEFEVIFVDDDSSDGSLALLESFHVQDPRIKVLQLSRNFGHQAALSAGLDFAAGDAVVLMDADLQDPPEVVEDFVRQWRRGYEVVYAVRRRRKESWSKRAAYFLFYRSMRWLASIDVPLDAGDFCLLDRAAADALRRMPESKHFLRGLRAWVGFRQIGVPYDRPARARGESKYTARQLIKLALSGYAGFSAAPLRASAWLGFGAALAGFVVGAWSVATRLLDYPAPRGWASTISVIMFIGGVQLIMLGVIGEYLGRVYDEVRRRPSYVIRKGVGFDRGVSGGHAAAAKPGPVAYADADRSG